MNNLSGAMKYSAIFMLVAWVVLVCWALIW